MKLKIYFMLVKNITPLIINFIPTGMVPDKNLTPHVPISPSEIIEQVCEAFELGITLVHLHARDKIGEPTWEVSIYDEIISGIRKYCPDIVICASLSGRNFPEFEKRTAVLELAPDMGSLTLGSMNFSKVPSINSPKMIHKLAAKMLLLGVNPELECFNSGMINYSHYLIAKDLIKPPYYFNLIVGNIFSAQMDITHIGTMINALPENSYWSLGGLGDYQLKANNLAILYNGGVRVGIEDNIWYDVNRLQYATNIELLKRIHTLARIHERKIMTSKEFGLLGFYNKNR